MSEFEEKVLNILEGIDKKLDKLVSAEISKRRAESSGSTTTSSTASVGATSLSATRSSTIGGVQETDGPSEEKALTETRRVCPKCSGTAFNAVEDKTQLLHSMGGVKIYAKKYVCRSCGHET